MRMWISIHGGIHAHNIITIVLDFCNNDFDQKGRPQQQHMESLLVNVNNQAHNISANS